MSNLIQSSFQESVYRKLNSLQKELHKELSNSVTDEKQFRDSLRKLDMLLTKLSRFYMVVAQNFTDYHQGIFNGVKLTSSNLSLGGSLGFIEYVNKYSPDTMRSEKISRMWNELPESLKKDFHMFTLQPHPNVGVAGFIIPIKSSFLEAIK